LVRLADDRRARVATHAVLPKSAAELGTPDEDTVIDGQSPRAKSEPPPDVLVGALLGARYRVIGRLGHGGMGTVYEGIDEKAAAGEPSDVAIKVMAGGEGGTEGTRRFLREAKAAMRIESPHVTKVIGSGVDTKTGAQYLVMERLRGMDLADILHTRGALQPEPAVALFLQAAAGLRAAHGIGVVHRDVKPSNLFVHEAADGTVVLKVCDFGIAKQLVREGDAASTELTRTGGLLGSPLYMSPEQARSAKYVDERSDIFSLTITLHEALSGLKPWGARTSMGEIILAVCTEDVPSLSECAPWVTPALADVVARGLARDPAARFATIAELEAALEPFAAKGPLTIAQIAAVTDERRSKVEPRPTPHTADAVSVATNTEPARPKRTGIVVVAGALAVAGVIAAGVYGARAKTTTVSPSGGPNVDTAATVSAPLASASAPPSASASTSASSTASAAPSTSDARVARPRQPPGRASVAPNPQPPSPASASTVGRGVTATDLPP
ncbi:MAG TPA: serine/threonine-protein kinase, partial [Labilithrix sp.]